MLGRIVERECAIEMHSPACDIPCMQQGQAHEAMPDGHPVDSRQIETWQAEVAKVKDSDELQALMTARHRALAHTANPNKGYKGKARVAVYGDERKAIEWTIPIVESANTFIGYTYVRPFDEQRKIRREHAAKFWDGVVSART